MSIEAIKNCPSSIILAPETGSSADSPLIDRVALEFEKPELLQIARIQENVNSLLERAQLNMKWDTSSAMRDLATAIVSHKQSKSTRYPALIYRTLGQFHDHLYFQETQANLKGEFRDIFRILFAKNVLSEKIVSESKLNWRDKGELVENHGIYMSERKKTRSKHESFYKLLLRLQAICKSEFIELIKVVERDLEEESLELTFKASGLISEDPLLIEPVCKKLLSTFNSAAGKHSLKDFFSLNLGDCESLALILTKLEEFEVKMLKDQAQMERLRSMR